ncbi:hypothetical protein CXG81DRAFT_26160 [Caulochytrium protostelioides]|uniref:Arrestin C-terminal-like domain-containing protein n=1 Tax=Caulochytrium protostelioides TaxID=1555241 RepID=A0A4P9X7E2_9FUNG|nr:hypothetical protein CXG81DRAFT_26160 [Caulochytrium protostelioides]|eukprot:RKP01145.1 hypothetical protein CXG81DRAFT_26160 [Caulochytrium protostelioides]
MSWSVNPAGLPVAASFVFGEHDIAEKDWPSDRVVPPLTTPLSKVRDAAHGTRIGVHLNRSFDLAGKEISGQIQICSTRKDVKLGEIAVYLVGYEQSLSTTRASRKIDAAPAPRLFLRRRLVVQDRNLPPTDCVLGGSYDEHGMWPARQGPTTLAFSIRLRAPVDAATGRPIALPSSFWHPQHGGVRYLLAVTLQMKRGTRLLGPIAAYREVHVLEHAPYVADQGLPGYPQGVARTSPLVQTQSVPVRGKYPFGLGAKGQLTVQGECLMVTERGDRQQGMLRAAWLAGTAGLVHLHITNASDRAVNAVELQLVRRIKTFTTTTVDADADAMGSADGAAGGGGGKNPYAMLAFQRDVVLTKTYVATSQPRQLRASTLVKTPKNAGGSCWNARHLLTAASMKSTDAFEGVAPQSTRTVSLDLPLPSNAYTLRHTRLVHATYVVAARVRVAGGGLSAVVEIPVTLLHPHSRVDDLPPMTLATLAAPAAVVATAAATPVAAATVDSKPLSVPSSPIAPTRTVLTRKPTTPMASATVATAAEPTPTPARSRPMSGLSASVPLTSLDTSAALGSGETYHESEDDEPETRREPAPRSRKGTSRAQRLYANQQRMHSRAQAQSEVDELWRAGDEAEGAGETAARGAHGGHSALPSFVIKSHVIGASAMPDGTSTPLATTAALRTPRSSLPVAPSPLGFTKLQPLALKSSDASLACEDPDASRAIDDMFAVLH